MVACCDHPQALDRVATSGRFGDLPPASEADVAAMTARWCAAAVETLAADMTGRRSDAADRLTWRAEDARKLRRAERGSLLKWKQGLRKKHGLPNDGLKAAMGCHLAACKAET